MCFENMTEQKQATARFLPALCFVCRWCGSSYNLGLHNTDIQICGDCVREMEEQATDHWAKKLKAAAPQAVESYERRALHGNIGRLSSDSDSCE